MLVQFSVENFMSIRDKAVLNLSAMRKDPSHPDNFHQEDKFCCLRSAMIYGANASGKSNLLKAMTSALLMIRESQTIQINSRLFRIAPFQFDDHSPSKSSAFEFVMIIDGVRYVYGFSSTQEKIIDEYLYAYFSQKRSLIFERSNTNNYHFTKQDSEEFLSYQKKNSPNKLFLATATAWNCEKTKKVFLWFSEKIDTYTDDNINAMARSLQYLDESDSPELRNFMIQILRNADINIDSYQIKSMPVSGVPQALRDVLGANRVVAKEYQALTEHVMPNGKRFTLDLGAESFGTQNLFCLSPLLFTVFTKGKTFFVDEMSCLHSTLVRYLVSLFHSREVNKKNAQLILITHDTNLLDLNLFRRDQIYFVQKDQFGVSELYSLDNFSPRKTENIRKSYLAGRYGAIPEVGMGGDLL